MEKVTLPKNVADSIGWLRGHQKYTNYDILQRLIEREFTNGHHAECIRDYIVLDDGFDKLLQALVNGYVVEQTPEDKVREMFSEAVTQEVECAGKLSLWWEGRRMTIIDTLDALGIKLSGVNAE